MKIQKDGNMYIIKADNFINLQESKDYFFIDEEEYKAFIKKTRRQLKFLEKLRKEVNMYQDFVKALNEAVIGNLLTKDEAKALLKEFLEIHK